MRTLRILLTMFALLLPTVYAEAITVTPTGATADVTFTEPTKNADGTPLADLHHCNVYAKPTVGSEVKGANLPATKASGGGTQTFSVSAGAGSLYVITATCTDNVGNESKRSPGATLDALAPAEPN